jgi:hypothetical protein
MINRQFTLHQIFLVLAFGLSFCACQTEKLILVKNSVAFDNEDPATIGNKDKKPTWVDAKNYKRPDDGNFYAVGVSNNYPFANLLRWSMEEAGREANSDAQIKIAEYIQLDLKSLLSSSIQDTLSVKQVKGKSEINQEGRDEFRMNVVASSSAVLQGLNSEATFWERYERVGKDGAVREYYTYYVLLRIPEAEIAKERERLAELKDFEAEQTKNLEMLKQQYNLVKETLRRLNYRENDAFYNEEFHKLLSIVTMLKNMKFSTIDSPQSIEKGELLKTAGADIVIFDPLDQQKQAVRMLQNTIDSLRSEIERLKNDYGGVVKEREIEIQLKDQKIALLQGQLENALGDLKTEISNLHSRGVTFVSQYTLFAYPPRPNERLVALEEKSVYIASAPINNREFSSFLTVTNGNNVSIDTSALENPVVNVSWIQAASYCNWLSRLYGYGEYYTINNGIISINEREDGYRLPSREEILAGLKEGAIESKTLINVGILGSDSAPGSMYAYRLSEEPGEAGEMETLLSERKLSADEYDVETGFRVVRNAKK